MVPFEVTPGELKRMLDGGEEVVLLDVREHEEFQLARVAGALHIPMGDIPGRTVDLDPEARIVVMCHLGQRSAMVTQFLRQRDFERVSNLAGGIDAWAREVDPGVGRD